jgi:methylenetetrahydrofolate dehydrogenase (NADP+)/methenyltetrahydrofolate cyclohydrolase
MKILDGKVVAAEVKDKVKERVATLNAEGKPVTLTVIQVGDNPASSVYVRNKEKACEYCGIESQIIKVPEDTQEECLLDLIEELNGDDNIDGILVQLPLPDHIDESVVLRAIDPKKDVDGFHPVNVGKLMLGEDTFVPCTAKGIIRLLDYYSIEIEGKDCVVVGRSNIVGKPVAVELMKRNGTVEICHSKTDDLEAHCLAADILICAIGKPKFFDERFLPRDAIVIDVGIHRLEDGSLCGDVDFYDAEGWVEAITPVPNGVGSMTVAMLMENCVEAAERRANL